MDGSPRAAEMMERFDRQFVLLEATMLAYALGREGGRRGFSERVVREISEMKLPHEIEGVATFAVEQLEEVVRLSAEVKREGKVMGRLAYMVTGQRSTGNVAKLLIGAFDVPVGVAMREQERGWYEVSLRGTGGCRTHLGEAVGKIASELGGSGGGHRKAAGARVRVESATTLLERLSDVV
jgi:RecJ-like exonuclease